jgi:hypothetical protein
VAQTVAATETTTCPANLRNSPKIIPDGVMASPFKRAFEFRRSFVAGFRPPKLDGEKLMQNLAEE